MGSFQNDLNLPFLVFFWPSEIYERRIVRKRKQLASIGGLDTMAQHHIEAVDADKYPALD